MISANDQLEQRLQRMDKMVTQIEKIIGAPNSTNDEHKFFRASVGIKALNTVWDVAVWKYLRPEVKKSELNAFEAKLKHMVDTLLTEPCDDWSFLLLAAFHGCDSLVKLCFDAGWDKNNNYEEGKTPLLVAMWKKHESVAALCIKEDCELNYVQAGKGWTALDYAHHGYCQNLTEALKAKGAIFASELQEPPLDTTKSLGKQVAALNATRTNQDHTTALSLRSFSTSASPSVFKTVAITRGFTISYK